MNGDGGHTVVPAEGFEYYQHRYWNDFEFVRRRLNERATGDATITWPEHLRDRWGPFERALVLNCGNGWVERDLVAKGVVRSAVGVDVSGELLDEARRTAADLGLPLEYVRCDTNLAQFPDGPFDLVVNHAALHHVAYLDRVLRRLWEVLEPAGILVSWDYVGPHRNQYRARQWEAAWDTNLALPPHVRQVMRYPDLGTMIGGDPTEAIHSEMILQMVGRYFDTEHRRDLGGGVGYLLLTHNEAIHGLDERAAEPFVELIMGADAALTAESPELSLFVYHVARPRPGALDDAELLGRWTTEEEVRESAAATRGGVYYPRTAIAALAEPLAGIPPDPDGIVPAELLLARVPGRALVRVMRVRLVDRFSKLWVRRSGLASRLTERGRARR